jgi:hypothetical protein
VSFGRDPHYAARLYQASCERLGYRAACEPARRASAWAARASKPFAERPLPRPADFDFWSTVDRDDFESMELHADTPAETLCTGGGRSVRFHKPAYACQAAAHAALEELDFDSALSYASIGCARHGDAANCRHAASLPLHMGMNGIQPPLSMTSRLQKLAHSVCSAVSRIVDSTDQDVTARECAHLARQFVLARDAESRSSLSPAARTFYDAIYDRGRAVRLMGEACARGGALLCDEQYALSHYIDPRDVAETRALDDIEFRRAIPANATPEDLERALGTLARERAAAVAARRAHFITYADLDETTETLEREAGDRIRAASAARLCMSVADHPEGEAAKACWTASRQAQDTGQFALALHYAAAGCERHGDAASCRLAAYLPLRMLEHGITPEPLFASELKRLGKAVCIGGLRVTNTVGRDVTGRVCHHYAWLFTPVQASSSASNAEPAERYLTALRDAATATILHEAACTRHAHFESCGAHVDPPTAKPGRQTARVRRATVRPSRVTLPSSRAAFSLTM